MNCIKTSACERLNDRKASITVAAHLLSSKTPPEFPARKNVIALCRQFTRLFELSGSDGYLLVLSVSSLRKSSSQYPQPFFTWIDGCIRLDDIFDGDSTHAWDC